MRLRVSRLGYACARSRLLWDESGIALIMAIGIMLVLTIVLTTVITLTAAGARDAQHKNAGQKAYALAEAGVNDALAVLGKNYPGSAAYPGDSTLLTTPQTTTYTTGTVTWSGNLAVAPAGAAWGAQWNITSAGTVSNPTGPGAASVTRRVTAIVPVVIPTITPVGSNNPLNFIYAKNDLQFQQATTIASPIYAERDLRLENGAKVNEFIGNDPSSPNRLAVGGNLYEQQNADTVGHVLGSAASNELAEAHIVKKCSTKTGGATLHNCVWGSTDQVWASLADNSIPPDFLSYTPQLTCCSPFTNVANLAPAQTGTGWSNMGAAYLGANLGPRQPCSTGSVPFSFGGDDSLINNSATPTGTPAIELTPTSGGYSCKSRSGGEITWDTSSTPHTLTVQGLVFIDGSATISSPTRDGAVVRGQGVIFLTGTFWMGGGSLLCVATVIGSPASKTKCDTSPGAWDPNQGALIVVADGDGQFDSTQAQGGTNVPNGVGIDLKGAFFQGGLIARKDVNVETTSEMQGPMISVYDNVHAGQTNVLTFPPLQFAPGGSAEIGPTPAPTLLPARQFGGG